MISTWNKSLTFGLKSWTIATMKERTELREYWARKSAERRERVKRMEEEEAEESWKAEQAIGKANGVSENVPHDSSGFEDSV